MTAEQYNQSVDKYSDGLYRFVLKSIRDTEKARDIVQDSFEKLWIKLDNVSGDKVKSYLFTTAYHSIIDTVRKDKYVAPYDPVEVSALTDNNQYSDLNHILHEALNRLPDIQRSVVLLRDYEGYSYEEIGEITNLSEAQVKVYIFRARSFLKNYIGSLETVI
jgi:RNA polymerase sigma-70 factor (ECF subfamily)